MAHILTDPNNMAKFLKTELTQAPEPTEANQNLQLEPNKTVC